MGKGSLHSRELSQKLGMSKDYLCVYRSFNKHLKSYDEAYDEVIKRRQDDENTINAMQSVYYELSINKDINRFGKHLVEIGIYSNARSLHRLLNQAFMVRTSLLQKENLKLYKTILKEYEEWKKWQY